MLTWRNRLPRTAGSSQVWLRRGFRALFAATLLVLLLLGVRDVVRPFLAAPSRGPTANATESYPREAAEAFAVRYALAYLTFDAAHPDQRQQALRQYASGDSSWDGQGRQAATLALPSGIDIRDSSHALVTVEALVGGGRWVYLAVPVVTDGQRMAVAGTPALVPGPGLADGPVATDAADQDPGLSGQLRPYLTAFLSAYAASSQAELAYYAAPGVELAGLGGQVTLAGLDSLSVEQPTGDARSAVAVVRWTDPASGGTLTQRYRLQLIQVSGKWLVGDVGPAA